MIVSQMQSASMSPYLCIFKLPQATSPYALNIFLSNVLCSLAKEIRKSRIFHEKVANILLNVNVISIKSKSLYKTYN